MTNLLAEGLALLGRRILLPSRLTRLSILLHLADRLACRAQLASAGQTGKVSTRAVGS